MSPATTERPPLGQGAQRFCELDAVLNTLVVARLAEPAQPLSELRLGWLLEPITRSSREETS